MRSVTCHQCQCSWVFNLSNRVTDLLESSSVLIYFKLHIGLYTQVIWRDAVLITNEIKQRLKRNWGEDAETVN
jgi:hypothetical protein